MAALLRQLNFNLTPRGGAVGEVALEIQNDDYISRQISEYILPLFDDGRPGIEHAVLERSFQNSHLFCPLIWRVLRRARTMERYRYLVIPDIPPEWDTYGLNEIGGIGRPIPINRNGLRGFVEDSDRRQQTLGLYFNGSNIAVWNEIVTRIVNGNPEFVDRLARAVIRYSEPPPSAPAPAAAPAPAPAPARALNQIFNIDGPNSGHIPYDIQMHEQIQAIVEIASPRFIHLDNSATFEKLHFLANNSHFFCPLIWRILSHARTLPVFADLAIPEIPERWKSYGALRLEDRIGGGEFDAGRQTAGFFFKPDNVRIWNETVAAIVQNPENVRNVARLVIQRPAPAAAAQAPAPSAAAPPPRPTITATPVVARRPAAAVAESAVSVIPPAELAREPLVETNIPRIMLGDVNRLVFGQPFNSTRPPARANSERLLQTRRNTRLQAIRERERGLQADAVAEAAAQADRNRIAAAAAAAQAERNRIDAAAAAAQAERNRIAAAAAAAQAERDRRAAAARRLITQAPPSARRRTRKARKTRNRK